MTGAELARLRASPVPKRVVYGAGDPQMSPAAARRAAASIGAPPPVAVPGRHLTMIASPQPLAAAFRALIGSVHR
jgi:pimeloyl-ACP methyl ester carboxylesterase